MESNPEFGLVGGISRVVVLPAKTPLPGEEGEEIELHFCGSSYEEKQSWTGDQLLVTHSLTLCTPLGMSAIIDPLVRGGMVAIVTLSSGAEIIVGYSSRHGVDAPLRLTRTELSSGEKRLDYPLKSWFLESQDSVPLI